MYLPGMGRANRSSHPARQFGCLAGAAALGDGVVGSEHALDGSCAGLDVLTELGTGMTGHSGLLECGLALVIGKGR